MCQTISRTSKPRICTIIMLFVLMILIGCATGPETAKIQSGILPKPGAKIAVTTVGNKSGEAFEYDLEPMLKNAIITALIRENILSDMNQKKSDFTLSLYVTEYRPGNAFKRWLLPGYGSTVLAVEGELRNANDNQVIGTISHKQGIHAGGAYTIGAWSSIFNIVATDIAKDLKVKIEEGGAFVVRLPPRSDVVPDQKQKPLPYTVFIGAFSDSRPEKGRIGKRTAAFDVSMGNIYFYRTVPAFLRESIETELALMGYRIVNTNGDINVKGEIVNFWIETDTTPLYWDIMGNVQIKLTIASDRLTGGTTDKVYSCNKTTRTYVWPSEELSSEVMDKCINELMKQINTDSVWEAVVTGSGK